MVKNLSASAGDVETQPRSLGEEDPLEEGMAAPVQYCCLENPMYTGAWQATVHRVAKSQTQLKQLSTHTHTIDRSSLTLAFYHKINILNYI